MENNADWYGLDKEVWDNSNTIASLNLGDEIWVLELGNYTKESTKHIKLPAKAKVVAIYEYEIDVEIEGVNRKYPYEIYESQFGIKKENGVYGKQ